MTEETHLPADRARPVPPGRGGPAGNARPSGEARAPGEVQPPRKGRTVRQRLLVMVIAMLGLALLLTGLLTFAVQYTSLSDRAETALTQEVGELASLARNGPLRDGEPYTDAQQLFYDFILTSIAGDEEAFLTLLDGEIAYFSSGDRPFRPDHPDITDEVLRLDVPEGRAQATSLRTQGTVLRMLVADVQLPEETRRANFVVLYDLGQEREQVHRQVLTYLGASLLVLLAGGSIAHLVLGRLLRPLEALREATAQISPDDLSRRVDVATAEDTDVAELGVRFNRMLDRIEDGVNQQRQFLDDAAHELRTPLTILRGNTELLRPQDPEDVATTRVLLLDEVDRMQRLVDDLLVLARSQRPDFVRSAPVDLTELAVECMDRVTMLGDRQWRLAAEAQGTLTVDRQRIIQAVVQLVANAVKFSEPGTVVEVATGRVEGTSTAAGQARAAGAEPARAYVTLSVADEGIGIPEEQRERIFERFGRGDNIAQVEGSGLGLPIVRAIAEAHGGAVTVGSTPGRGSRFTLWLPDTGAGAPQAEE